ncbi:MAG: response regulator transcription factor [Anaerolineales bacterium]
MSKTINIGILDDHPAIADGYKTKIELQPDVKVSWIAHFYQDVEPFLQENPTDAIILDIQVYNAPGDVELYPILHAIPDLQERYPNTKIVIISMLNRPAIIKAIHKLGVSGYILKSDHYSYENLGKVMKDIVERSKTYFSPEAAKFLTADSPTPDLTTRQQEVLSLMASNPGLSYQEMADTLFISVNTLRNHVAVLCKKLGVNNRTSAITRARQIGLVVDDPI